MWKNTYKKAIPRTANVFKSKFTNKIQSQIDANENFIKKILSMNALNINSF